MSELAPIPGFTKLTGPPFVGIAATVFLFGLLTLQCYGYCIKYRNDYLVLKLAVLVTFLVELASTVMSVADGYHWFVRGFGDPNILAGFYLANFDSPILGSIVAIISQAAYCWRIYRLSGMKILPIFILAIVFGSEVSYLAVGIFNQTLVTIADWTETSTRLTLVWAVGNVISDNLIAAMMMYLLLNNTSLRGVSRLGRWVRLILESNVLSALVSVLLAVFTLVGSLKPPKTSMFLAPGYVLSKLYSNCMLIMLNNRMYAGDVAEESADFGIGGHAVPLRPRYIQTFEKVIVNRETAVHFDDTLGSRSTGLSSRSFPEFRFSEV